MSVKWRLAAILEEKGITPYQLSQLIGLSVPACYDLVKESDAKRINFPTLDKLCEALDCTPGDLLEYTRPKKRR